MKVVAAIGGGAFVLASFVVGARLLRGERRSPRYRRGPRRRVGHAPRLPLLPRQWRRRRASARYEIARRPSSLAPAVRPRTRPRPIGPLAIAAAVGFSLAFAHTVADRRRLLGPAPA